MSLAVRVYYFAPDEDDLYSTIIDIWLRLVYNEKAATHVAVSVDGNMFAFDWYGARMIGKEERRYLMDRLITYQDIFYEDLSVKSMLRAHSEIADSLAEFRIKEALLWVLNRKPLTCTGYVQHLLGKEITNPTPVQLYRELEHDQDILQEESSNTED